MDVVGTFLVRNNLCITYTMAAAKSLKSRLRQHQHIAAAVTVPIAAGVGIAGTNGGSPLLAMHAVALLGIATYYLSRGEN